MVQKQREASYYMRCRISSNSEAREPKIDKHHNTIADRYEIIKTSIIPGWGGDKVSVERKRINDSGRGSIDEGFPPQLNDKGDHGDGDLPQESSGRGDS